MRLPASIATGLLLTLSGTFGASPVAPTTLDDCDAKVRAAPRSFDSYGCYWFVGRNQGMLEPAARHLESMLDVDPGNPRIELYLGILLADLGQGRAVGILEEAAEGFVIEGDPRGEVYARITLAMNHGARRHASAADRELETALARTLASGERDLEAQVRIQLVWRRYYAGEYGEASRQLDALQSVVFPDGSIHHRLDTLDAMAAISWALGRDRVAMDDYAKMLELLDGADPYRESTVRRNMALVGQNLAAEGRITDEELVALKREALDAAIRGGNRLAEPGARLMLANMLTGEEGVEQARQGLALARELDKTGDTCWGLWLLAEKLQKLDPAHPEPAFALVEESIELARSHDDAENLARGAVVRAKMRWKSGPRERAVTDSLEALDAIERIRDLQPEGEPRARVFGRFADDYRWISGRLLESAEHGASDREIPRAFLVIERMRARSLLDTLDASGVTGLRGTPLSSIPEVQERLRPDQAMLSYQILDRPEDPGDELRGRSWVVVITRAGAEAIALERCAGIDRRIRLFLSLVDRRDGSEQPGAERLHRDLLSGALRELPAEVTSLIVVPDGPLHRLPFGALIDPERTGSLAERFELAVAPSASSWIRLSGKSTARVRPGLLALADPLLPHFENGSEPRWREWTAAGGELQPLPGARREASALGRHLGSAGSTLTGAAATESALSRARLSDYALIHFATHAVVNDEYPERTAIVLAAESVEAPDPERRDGLLGFREVIELKLDGQVVVLSSCRSASGPLIDGEGVMGLANAFFQAGAQTVVAGLWKVRDRETATLIERFGLHLGSGESVAGAMALARRESIRDGAPAAAWAGMVVLGNGDAAPFAGAEVRTNSWPRGLPVAAAVLFVVLVAVLVGRARGIRKPA